MVKWKFWSKGDGEKRVTTLSRLENEGILKILNTNTLQTRIHELHDDLTEAFKEFREGSSMSIMPPHLLALLPEKERTKYIKKRIKAIQKQREALDKIVLALSDQAWPWNRAGDDKNRLMAWYVDQFLQDYEELKEVPAYYDDLFTMALSIVQKSYKGEDVTQAPPIVIFTPSPGKQFSLKDLETVE